MHFFVDFVRRQLVGWRPGNSGWVVGNCPVCVRMGEPRPDTKRRGGFQFDDDTWVYHCFNCGFNTGWSKGNRMSRKARLLLEGFGFERSDIQRLSIELMREEETANLLSPLPAPRPIFKPQWPTVELPEGSQFIDQIPESEMTTNFNRGIEMLSQRNLLPYWSDWVYNKSNFKFRNRIILPYRYKNHIVGYSARTIGENKSRMIPKYFVQKPNHFVFNLDHQVPDRSYVVVVEGDYDAISIDGLALGSNSLSDEQASLVEQLNRRVILLPDADAAGERLISRAIDRGWSVSFPDWMMSHKDANSAIQEYGRAFVLKSIEQYATDNVTKIRVLAKKFLRD